MRQKLQFTVQILLLVFLPAFVMRPVVVSVANSFQNSDARPVQKCSSYQVFTGNHENWHSVSREDSHIPTLSPRIQKTVLASSEGRVFVFVSTAVRFSPQSSLVLRI